MFVDRAEIVQLHGVGNVHMVFQGVVKPAALPVHAQNRNGMEAMGRKVFAGVCPLLLQEKPSIEQVPFLAGESQFLFLLPVFLPPQLFHQRAPCQGSQPRRQNRSLHAFAPSMNSSMLRTGPWKPRAGRSLNQ